MSVVIKTSISSRNVTLDYVLIIKDKIEDSLENFQRCLHKAIERQYQVYIS